MPTTVNDELLDQSVGHQINLMRLGTGIVRKIIAILEKTDKDLLARVERRARDGLNNTRLNALLAEIRKTNKDAYAAIERLAKRELASLAVYEADYQISMVQTTVPIEVNVLRPATDLLVAVVTTDPFEGALLKEWVQGLSEGRYRRVRDSLRKGMVAGDDVGTMVRALRGTKANNYKDGILEISRRAAEAMVRTAVNHVATRSREVLYKRNEDIVKGIRWVSTLDNRTTPVCQARDGKVYPVDSGPRPPAHINCRSTTVPVLKSWREMGIDLDEMSPGTRASMDGQVPGDLTYEDWLRSKPAAFQDEVLGPTKGRAFRSGVSLDKFVDKTGKAYTIAQLREREIV